MLTEHDLSAHFINFQVLGSGFEVISVGKKKLVRSVPTELNKDHNEILEVAQVCCLVHDVVLGCTVFLFSCYLHHLHFNFFHHS